MSEGKEERERTKLKTIKKQQQQQQNNNKNSF